uniref:Uncharacterized protein n=1 Tax=Magallana gigas TaxID=29159 RepID=A0A8W8HYA2_MAGGI
MKLSKRNPKHNAFFQRPLTSFESAYDVWYVNAPIKYHTLEHFQSCWIVFALHKSLCSSHHSYCVRLFWDRARESLKNSTNCFYGYCLSTNDSWQTLKRLTSPEKAFPTVGLEDEVSPSQITKVCCITCSKEDIGNASHNNTCIKEVMSRTRKRIRQYNDHLDDLGLKDADGRPCRKCKESTLRECQALVKELQRAKDQFQESSMKNKFPCDYGFECANVAMRNGAKGRSKMKQSQHDSGYHSVNSEILGKEPKESMDDNQTASADTTHPKDLNIDTHTEPPSSSCDKADVKGPCVTLDVSIDDNTDA